MKQVILLFFPCMIFIFPATGQLSEIATETEKQAIREVIDNETLTYYRQDFEAWKDNFITEDYFREHAYWEGYPEKVRYYYGFDTLARLKQEQFEKNRTVWRGSEQKKTHENFRIYPDVAWYSFEQESYEYGTGRFLGRSVELRILEKKQGKWKIAYLGFHFIPLETDSSNNEIQAGLQRPVSRQKSIPLLDSITQKIPWIRSTVNKTMNQLIGFSKKQS